MWFPRSRRSIFQRVVAAIDQYWVQSRRERWLTQVRQRRTPWSADDRCQLVHVIEPVESRVLLTGSDSFAGRTNLGSVISVTDTGTNVAFTGEAGEPAQSGTINSAWWSWTAPSNGTLVVDTIGSSFDTFLTLATGSAVNALSVIAQDDDGGGGVASKITASVTSGTAYQIAVDGFNSATGAITLNLAFAAVGTEDFGDAPNAVQSGFASSYPTLLADNGARHTPLAGFSIGSNIDTEGDGKPSAAANLDDTTGATDDEDGVTFNGTLTAGNSGSISVFVTNSAGVINPYLDAWIDYNRDGDWSDSGEQIFSGAVVTGTNTLNFVVPGGAPTGQTFSRFRLHDGTTGLAVTGLSAEGEVEDYAVSIASPGTWTAQGPGPTINAQVRIPANHPVNGAIQSIAAHPTNSDIVFVGTVNGGVWKTTNATTSNTWTPLTATLQSQSIGAIEFDVTDLTFNTLLAGTGRWSNYASIGDDQGLLYYTTNGGTSWTVFAPAVLNNLRISAVAARGNTWLVTSTSGGVFRSIDGGANWANINGANGLGTGNTQDLAANPSNANQFYVSMTGGGGRLFRTDDVGATWTDVTGTVTGVSGASRVRLAVNASAGAVYVAVGAGGAGAATNVWRSADQGGNWTQLDQVFVHNGGQQNPNTSLAADPTNANLVYVGGDRITSSPFTALIYRGDASAAPGSQWTILVDSGATSTSPHADTRDMAFRADGTLLQSDDGGMYRHTNPTGTGSWVAAAGNIQAVEAHNVAYNSLNDTLVIGTQDNGTHLQPTSGNTQWNFINGGDGGDMAVDSITLAGSNQSIVYLSSQNLGGFRRVVYDINNNFVSSTSLAGITSPTFTTPIELNSINPQRLLIGGSSALFESANQGTTNSNIGGPGQPGFLQNAMVYGGSLGGTPNPDLIYVGANSTVHKRTTSGGSITATTALPAGAGQVNDVAIDPDNYDTVFATDSNQVFLSSNGGTSWSDITGNLGTLSSLNEIRTAVYVPGAAPYLAVGTRSGVFVSLASSYGTWVKLGSALPDVLVFDLVYNATDDVLVASTFGRGVWTLPNASAAFDTPDTGVTLGGGTLTITDNDGTGNNNQFTFSRLDANTFQLTDTSGATIDVSSIAGSSGSGTASVTIPTASVTSVAINGALGNDTLNVDFSGGNFVVPITFDGGGQASVPGDTLVLTGGSTTSQTFNFTNEHDGSVVLAGALAGTINYTGLEPVSSSIDAADVILNYSTATEVITVSQDGTDATLTKVDSDVGGESVSFVNPTGSLQINGGNTGNDTITVNGFGTSGGGFNAALTINGGSGDDTVNLNADITFAAGKSLDVDLQNDDATPGTDIINVGTNANLILSGSGVATLKTSKNIAFASGSSIATVDGGITIEANQQAIPTSGDFKGIDLDNAAIGSTTGTVTLKGRGGDSNAGDQFGVYIHNGATVGTGTTTQVTVQGTGGASSGNSNTGVRIVESNSRITSGGGNVSVTGTGGGTSTSAVNDGILVLAAGQITAGGSGTVTVLGTGASSSGNFNIGVYVENGSSQITSSGGSVSVTGNGGGSGGGGSNWGVFASSGGTISVGGSALLTVTGTGGSSSGTDNFGVIVNASITAGSGGISITGTPGSGTGALGFNLLTSSGAVTTTGTGNITIIADSQNIGTSTSINAGSNTVTLRQKTNTTPINLGTDDSAGTLGLTDAELKRITAGKLTVGDANSGNVTISSAVSPTSVTTTFEIISGGAIGDTNTVAADIVAPGVILNGNVTPGTSPGLLRVTGNVTFANNDTFTVEIGGTSPGNTATDHDQLDATGSVTIGTNVTLATSSFGVFVPTVSQTFEIINRTGGTGTFAGLAEGATISNFLGSGLLAKISYVGGDGDDIVLVAAEAPSFVVTTTSDVVDAFDSLTSLREAILYSNSNVGLDTISFAIAGAGVHTISVTSQLPEITDGVIIDGTTQGVSATPLIELDGTNAGAGALGLNFTAGGGGSTVKGLVINRFNIAGIRFLNCDGNLVVGNFIGTDATGTADLGNGSEGVQIYDSDNNTIGGTTAADRNLISGNDGNGVAIDSVSTGNVVLGNLIGTNLAGTAALGNSFSGVVVAGGSNTIGGTGAGAGNVISGNARRGVYFTTATATSNLVQGNYIGTDINGTADLGNTLSGVQLDNGASSNTIGGTTTAARNVISGNNEYGVRIQGFGVTLNNNVQGNYIGTDVNGTAAIGNSLSGVQVNATSNTIGGTAAGAGNLISGNVQHGVLVQGGANVTNLVQGNFIGTDVTGAVDLGNLLSGVQVLSSTGNTIGGTSAGARNVISGNDANGVDLTGASTATNLVQGNYIGTNAAGTGDLGNTLSGVKVTSASNTIGGTTAGAGNLISGNDQYGVRLQGFGTTTNNNVQGNYIGTDVNGTTAIANSLSGVQVNATANTIGGAAAGAGNLISGNTQNGVLVQGGVNAQNVVAGNFIGTDVNGTANLGNLLSGVQVLNSQTNTIGGTTAAARNVISGNNENGVYLSGAGSTTNLVQGNYIGTDFTGTSDLGNTLTGVWVVAPNNTVGGTAAGAGNVISGNNRFGISIQGVGSTGNNVQGNLIGTDPAGTGTVANTLSGVLMYDAGSNTIGGTTASARNVISGNIQHGVFISQTNATSNVVSGNYIGTDINGTANLGNLIHGVYIEARASSNTIGGTAAGAGNVISGNNQHGVYLLGFGGAGVGVRLNLIQGNRIGTDVNGTADLGNTLNGVQVQATDNTIGGTAAGAGNLISGNDQNGVNLQGGANANTLVQGNLIGTQADGTSALANSQNGVLIQHSTGNTVGGTTAGSGNTIALNTQDGVALFGTDATASTNSILGNSIFSNGQLGIDLGNNGANANDVDDPDAGPNHLQNFPAFASVVLNGPNLDITYSVPSINPNSIFPLRIEFYIADANNQEGKTFLGSDSYTTPGAKLATISAGTSIVGTKIVATATDANGNTSEFSAFATVA